MKVLEFKTYFQVLRRIIKNEFQVLTSYKADLVITIVSLLGHLIIFYIFLSVIFAQTDSLLGYTKDEVLLIWGIAEINYAFMFKILYNIQDFSGNIVRGDLDNFLLKPINPIIHTIISRFDPYAVFSLITGILITATALQSVSIELGIVQILSIILIEILMIITFVCLMLSVMFLSFWVGEIDPAFWVFDTMLDLMRYPNEVLIKYFKYLFGVAVPFGLYGAVQVSILLGRFNYYRLILYVFIALSWYFIMLTLWKRGLMKYSSASSVNALNIR